MIGLAGVGRAAAPIGKARPALGALALALLAACGSSRNGLAGDDTEAATNAGVSVTEPWTRPTPPGAQSTAFYLTVVNDSAGEDRVLGASSSRCGTAEVHRSSMSDGVMSMAPAEPRDLQIAPARSLIMEPGGLHIMCMGLTEPVEEGHPVDLTIRFEQAGEITANAQVVRTG